MTVRMEARCKVVCWDLDPGEGGKSIPPYDRELQAIDLVHASTWENTRSALGLPGDSVLLITGFSSDAANQISELRKDAAWSGLPVFAAVPGQKIDADMQGQASSGLIELLPMPIPPGRFWSQLRDAGKKYRVNAYKTSSNRRRYFRVPLSVSALCLVEAQTIDIGVGGIQFNTNHTYKVGDRGRIDIPLLHETIGEALTFQVVSMENLARGEYRFNIRAQFVDLDAEARKKLGKALAVVEPGAWSPE